VPQGELQHDLRVFDQTPQMVFGRALALAKTRLPEWEPREDATEAVLLEALAVEVSETIMALNRVPLAVLRQLFKLWGLKFYEGANAVATIEVETIDDLQQRELPAGSVFVYQFLGKTYRFLTTKAVVVPDGDFYVTVPAICDIPTDIVNGETERPLLVFQAASWVKRATLKLVQGGRNPETDAEWLSRGVEMIKRMHSTIVSPAHFEHYMMSDDDVTSCRVIDCYDPSNPANQPGEQPGHVAVVAFGHGAPLTLDTKLRLLGEMTDKALPTLQIHLLDPAEVHVNLRIIVAIDISYNQAETLQDIAEHIFEYTHNGLWKQIWTDVELGSQVGKVDGVAAVVLVQAQNTQTEGNVLNQNFGTRAFFVVDDVEILVIPATTDNLEAGRFVDPQTGTYVDTLAPKSAMTWATVASISPLMVYVENMSTAVRVNKQLIPSYQLRVGDRVWVEALSDNITLFGAMETWRYSNNEAVQR